MSHKIPNLVNHESAGEKSREGSTTSIAVSTVSVAYTGVGKD
jgi:hypothetical protein